MAPTPTAPALDEPARRALERALRAEVRGDVWFDRATRALYASDASNYRQVPLGVVCPLDREALVTALRVCAEHDVPVTARGTGTSLAGQAVNSGVILDTGRHLRRIVEVDPERRIARVEPGVVLDDLRRAAEVHGLTFGPDPATHAWCTIGGMLGNDACGTHSLVAGRTSDNVEALTVATYGGAVLSFGRAGTGPEAGPHEERDRILAALEVLVDQHAERIRARYPAIPRRVSGYGLDRLLPEHGFHVARALVGTESTCAVVLEATLRLVPSPRHRRLVVLGYPDVFAAADAVPALLAHPLLGLEGFDARLTELMRARPLHVEHLGLLPPGGAWLLPELGHDDATAADAATDALVAGLPPEVTWRRYDDPATQRRLWLVRESGLGATAIRPDGRHNLEGWEDAAVAPAKLGAYLRGITALQAEFGISGPWYGHFGEGCVHTRNDFDLASRQGVAAFRAYVERAADLVVSLGGSLSGEHGDGQSRGELLERMYGPELVEAFRRFKAIFDPRGRMNPGKVVDAYPLDANLRDGPERPPAALARPPGGFALLRDGGSLQAAAERCVGVGRCRRDDDVGTMCPSFRATRDEQHGTRGRARLLAELFHGDATPATWRNPDVRAALDLCLSCKGCAVDCPTTVDIATYKAEFLHHHYAGRLRPRADYALALVPAAARLGTRAPGVVNAVLGAPGVGTVLRRAAGVTTHRPLPRFARPSWRRSEAVHARRDRLDASVAVWPDTFTDAFVPANGDDTVAVLEAVGERVAIPSGWGCCGRPLYDSGMLGVARRWLGALLDVLEPWTSRAIPVVVPEPSCLAAFRDELPNLLADDPRAARLASLARSPAEHLLLLPRALERLDRLAAAGPGPRVAVHPHCHARAVGASDPDVAILARAGFDAAAIDAGCCGLAGAFGYRASNEALSRQIGLEQWLPRIAAATSGSRPADLVVDGFSCRQQAGHLAGLEPERTMALLRRRLEAAADAPGR